MAAESRKDRSIRSPRARATNGQSRPRMLHRGIRSITASCSDGRAPLTTDGHSVIQPAPPVRRVPLRAAEEAVGHVHRFSRMLAPGRFIHPFQLAGPEVRQLDCAHAGPTLRVAGSEARLTASLEILVQEVGSPSGTVMAVDSVVGLRHGCPEVPAIGIANAYAAKCQPEVELADGCAHSSSDEMRWRRAGLKCKPGGESAARRCQVIQASYFCPTRWNAERLNRVAGRRALREVIGNTRACGRRRIAP